MTRADDQARWRAKSGTKQINVQLSQTTVERLDALVAEQQLSGRGEAITRLLVDPPAAAPPPAPAPAHELTQEAVDALARLFKRMSTLRRLDLHAVITEEVIRRFPEDMKVEREELRKAQLKLMEDEMELTQGRQRLHASRKQRHRGHDVKADLKTLKQACHPDRREITPTLQSKAMQVIQHLEEILNY